MGTLCLWTTGRHGCAVGVIYFSEEAAARLAPLLRVWVLCIFILARVLGGRVFVPAQRHGKMG